VSSILDALRKFEAAEVPAAPAVPTWTAPRSKIRWIAVGLVAAFAAGVGLTFWLRREQPPAERGPTDTVATAAKPETVKPPVPVTPTPPNLPAPVSPPVPTPVVAATPPVAEAPPVAAAPAPVAVAAPPVAVAPPPASPPAPAPAEAPAAQAPPPAQAAAAALPPAAPAPPLPQAVVDAAPPRVHVESPPAAAPEVGARPVDAPPEVAAARPPADAPRIQVSFLVYSAVPARRTVAFTVDGGSLLTLHEGESSHNVAVERIFADRVELRHAGRTFTVRARD
jgi:hypothetical protein